MRATCSPILADKTIMADLRDAASVAVCLPDARGIKQQTVANSRAYQLIGGTETVLIVEDEQIVLTWAREALQLLGYTVLSTQDPGDAVVLGRSHAGPIHFLLTDVVLPGMDGPSLYERLLESQPEMKVIYMSGYASSLLEHYNVATGDPNFLQKPFALESLAQKIREALAESEKARPA